MTEKLRQSLSAVIDDEADAFELRRVLDELGRDAELRALWDRYHLIGNVLRGEPAVPPNGLRDRVWAALDDAPAAEDTQPVVQPAPATPAPPRARARVGRFTGLAVAASVAFAVVVGFNGLQVFDDEPAPTVASTRGDVDVTAAQEAAGPRGPVQRVDLDVEVSPLDVQRAQAYMLHHAQQQALNQAGVMSFVKLATYEAP